MDASTIYGLLKWELVKLKSRGFYTFLGFLLWISYFSFMPRLVNAIYLHLPSQNFYLIYTLGTYFSHLISFALINSFYFSLYFLKHPKIESCKSSPEPWPWETSSDFSLILKKLIKLALLNNLITIPVTLAIFGLRAKFNSSPYEPSLPETLSQVFFFMIIEDFFFYWSHRALHTPWLYSRFHKLHHEYKVNFSPSAEYAHPFEYIFGNSLPVALGPLIYGQNKVHLVIWFTWVFFRTGNNVEGHSGYDFPWSPFRFLPFCSNASFHEFHHLKNQGNFASLFAIWDSICGTDHTYFKEVFKKKE